MKNFDSLDQTFDITPNKGTELMKKTRKEVKALAKLSEQKDQEASYVRAKLYEMSEKLSEAANESLEVALESQHPRAFEVCSNTMKACAEVAEKITDLHKKHNDLSAEEVKQQAVIQAGGTQQNIFFSGSTQEMMQMIKEANKSTDKETK